MTPMEHATDAAAGAMVTSPMWLHAVETGHTFLDGAYACAQFTLPFMGIAWLAMQMYHKHKDRKNK